MELKVTKVDCFNRDSIPDENETIADDLNFDELVKNIKSMNIYFRYPRDCPFARGNWLIDLQFKDGGLLCLKLPKEMTEEKVHKFCHPLIDYFKNKAH
jgi:hypothetical protein